MCAHLIQILLKVELLSELHVGVYSVADKKNGITTDQRTDRHTFSRVVRTHLKMVVAILISL